MLAVALNQTGSTVLLDEKRARRFAKQRGIAVVGTAGVVLLAKRRRLIPAARPVLGDLLRTGFRLSDDLYRGVVERADEA